MPRLFAWVRALKHEVPDPKAIQTGETIILYQAQDKHWDLTWLACVTRKKRLFFLFLYPFE